MDVPPPSSTESNPQAFNEEQPQQLMQAQPPATLSVQSASNMIPRSAAAGTTEYTSTSHKYTLSTCATTASGPSTSQTWASGPGTLQITCNLIQDGDSAMNTSLQGSGRITPIDMQPSSQQFMSGGNPPLTAQPQQTVSPAQWESQTIRTTQASQSQNSWTVAPRDPNVNTDSSSLSINPRLEPVSESANTAQSQQVGPFSANQWGRANAPAASTRMTSNSQQAISTTQWNSELANVSQTYSTSQAQATETTTALTAFDGRDNQPAQVPPRSMATPDGDWKGSLITPMSYYDRPIDNINIAPNSTSQEPANSRQSSGLVNVGPSSTIVDPQNRSTQNRRVVTGEPRESVRIVSSELDYANQKVSENVVRREYGEARVISTQERRDESRSYVKSERFITHEVKVPKRVTREQIVERTVVEQEKQMVEEIVQEQCTVKERVVEWSRPKVIEKVVEQPETVYQETTINVTEKIQKSNVKFVNKDVVQERLVSKPVVIERPVPKDVVEIKERIVPIEKIVEVEVVTDEPRIVEKAVPQYVDVPVPNVIQKEVIVDVERNLPECVEAEIVCDVKVPSIMPRYKKIAYPVYLPKFIEVPIAVDLMTESLQSESTEFVSKINGFTKTAASLCDIENLASNIMRMDLGTTAANLMSPENLQAAVMKVWNSGSTAADANLQYNSGATGTYSVGATGTTTTTGGVVSSAQYMSPTYASSRNYKTEIPQRVVAVS